MSKKRDIEDIKYRLEWMTDDQFECYEFLADLFLGWHHISGKITPIGSGIRLSTTQVSKFSTFDYNALTRAVIMAHDRLIRFSIVPSGPFMLGLVLHKRHKRDGAMHERHPTIEEAIKAVRGKENAP